MTDQLLAARVESLDAKIDTLFAKVSEIREMLAEERGRRKGAYALATVLGTLGGFFASFVWRH